MVLGAGQLARMMALAGTPLGVAVCAFDVRSQKVVHPITLAQTHDSLQHALDNVDVVTAEFEHVPHDILAICEASGKLAPASSNIKIGGDRRLEKAMLDRANANNASHVIVDSELSLNQACEKLGVPLVLKSALDGYDGKGQWRIKQSTDIEPVWQDIAEFLQQSSDKQGIVAEQFIPFDREVSLIGARNARGEVVFYPLAENIHVDGVLSLSLAEQGDSAIQQQAETMFKSVAEELNYVGVLAIEFFQVGDQLLVNEIAPRVHNSGHWTQQGADTCQFENHLRAVLNLPLGSTKLIRPTAMINILGEDNLPDELLTVASLHMHWYGKDKRAGRKMGHINVSGKDKAELALRLQQVAGILCKEQFPALNCYR
nr:5-(carboxyamino)imidazole ribonucleotide synthase [Neptunicella marina]